MDIAITDQWKLDGDCGKCRRANYCSKDCSARKRRTERIVKEAFYDFINEKNPEFAAMLNSISSSTIK